MFCDALKADYRAVFDSVPIYGLSALSAQSKTPKAVFAIAGKRGTARGENYVKLI